MDGSEIAESLADQVEESLSRVQARGRYWEVNDRIREIAKEGSSFANSSGGTLIYGIAEYVDPDKEHLPERIDPVNREDYLREWVEQLVNTIQPRIDQLTIIPVNLSCAKSDVIYALEAPQSTTAHQVRDNRYYKRFNFKSVSMDDCEIRDVMARAKYPSLSVDFSIEKKVEVSRRIMDQKATKSDTRELVIEATNSGFMLAK